MLCTRATEDAVWRRLRRSSDFEVFEDVLGETGHLVELVDRAEAAEALSVGQQAGRLGHREVLLAQLLEGDRVQVDRASLAGPGLRGRLTGGGTRRGAAGKGGDSGVGGGA